MIRQRGGRKKKKKKKKKKNLNVRIAEGPIDRAGQGSQLLRPGQGAEIEVRIKRHVGTRWIYPQVQTRQHLTRFLKILLRP